MTYAQLMTELAKLPPGSTVPLWLQAKALEFTLRLNAETNQRNLPA